MAATSTWSASLQWWNRRRLTYNIGLALAGLLAFGLYVAAFEIWTPKGDDSEITLFTTAFQAVGYLCAMALANVCFFVGPLSELLLRPKDPQAYRFKAFWAGFAGSVALPFAVPTLFYIQYGLGR